MPLQKLQMRPGVNRESTNLANEGTYYACDKVRFRSGQPENIGGWETLTSNTFLGVCRNLIEWVTLAQPTSFTLVGLGTNLKFYVYGSEIFNVDQRIYKNGSFYDITPFEIITANSPSTVIPADPFYAPYSTLNGSITATSTTIALSATGNFDKCFPIVVRIGSEDILVASVSSTTMTVAAGGRGYNGTTAAAHSSGAVVSSSYLIVDSPANSSEPGAYVTYQNATAFSVYTAANLNKNFEIKAVLVNYVAIDVGIQSSSATNGGGSSVVGYYEIAPGEAQNTLGFGWGADVWESPTLGVNTVLTSDVAIAATTINVSSTASFASSGYIVIESEAISYTGKTGTSFTGCVRGLFGTSTGGPTTSHSTGVKVYQATGFVGTRGWGTEADPLVAQGIPIYARLWTSDTFGQDLLINVRNNAVYYWNKQSNLNAAGSLVELQPEYPNGHAIDMASTAFGADSWAPTVATKVLVTEERHIVVLGTNDPTNIGSTSLQDPMLVRWSDQENPYIWLPTPLNTAGFQRLAYGSKLITSEKTRQEVLIWSDNALYSMRYLGPPYTFGFNTISAEITIASPNCVTTASNITYWMGLDKFYVYSGRVDTLPCAIRQYIFDDLNLNELDIIQSGTNEKFNEVWWLYPSQNSTEIDRYAVYNYLEKLWYYGTIDRTAWLDSHIRTYPLATANNRLFLQEYGVDDATDPDDPQPIESYITSADFDLGEGEQYSFIKRIIPDVDFIGSETETPSVTFTVAVRNFPGQGLFTHQDLAVTDGTFRTIQIYDYTNQTWLRLRGRQVAFKIGSNELGVKWQLGVPRLEIQPDGKKT